MRSKHCLEPFCLWVGLRQTIVVGLMTFGISRRCLQPGLQGISRNKSEKSSTGLDPHNHWLNSAETAKVNCNLPISHTISAGDP